MKEFVFSFTEYKHMMVVDVSGYGILKELPDTLKKSSLQGKAETLVDLKQGRVRRICVSEMRVWRGND